MESMVEIIVGILAGCLLGGVTIWLVQGSRAKSRLARMEAELRVKIAELQGQLDQRDNAEKIIEMAKEGMNDTFQATANRALRDNNSLFLDVAQENFGKTLEAAKGDFKQHHERFEALVKPLSQDYGKLNPQIESLMRQNQELMAETGKLSNALTSSRQVGSWGEVQLRRVVELAGMQEYCDFAEQVAGGGSQIRPDLMVHLPEKRTVVVDAKASTEAYLEAQEAQDDASKEASLARHARALRTQVDDLASKDYGAKVEGSLDFVVMFVPGDQFLAAALNANPALIEHAMKKRVAIATPASLIALLWAVANGWQRQQIAENAEEILKEGQELHSRMLTFMKHFQSVGTRLQGAVDNFNKSVRSYESRVLPQGRRFAEMVTDKKDELPQAQQIESSALNSDYARDQV